MAYEFEVGAHQYRAEKLSGFDQFLLMRKLTPIMLSLANMAGGLSALLVEEPKSEGEADTAKPEKKFDLSLLMPLAEEVSKMSEADCRDIFTKSLSNVQRNNGGKWELIWSRTTNAALFNDIDMVTMLQIVVKVVQENLGDFTTAPHSTLTLMAGARG